jgi:hypothetical protein
VCGMHDVCGLRCGGSARVYTRLMQNVAEYAIILFPVHANLSVMRRSWCIESRPASEDVQKSTYCSLFDRVPPVLHEMILSIVLS